MPFQSKAQRRKCYALKAKGQAGGWDCDEWSAETKGKDIPEKVTKEGSSHMDKKAGPATPAAPPAPAAAPPAAPAASAGGGVLNDGMNAISNAWNSYSGAVDPYLEPVRGYMGDYGKYLTPATATALLPLLLGAGGYGVSQLMRRPQRDEDDELEEAGIKFASDRSRYVAVKAAMSYIDDLCSRMPLAKQARLRVVQANLADGYSVKAAIAAAYPAHDEPTREKVASVLAKGASALLLEKERFTRCLRKAAQYTAQQRQQHASKTTAAKPQAAFRPTLGARTQKARAASNQAALKMQQEAAKRRASAVAAMQARKQTATAAKPVAKAPPVKLTVPAPAAAPKAGPGAGGGFQGGRLGASATGKQLN